MPLTSLADWFPLFAAAAAYALLLHALLPRWLVPIGPDEFGYLKSAVETIQHGRPWTDDYLEPWAASLSCASALLYHVTGSMAFAVRGLQIGLAGGSFLALAALLRRRLHSRTRAILVSAIVLTFPVLLRRSAEYIDLILYLPCLLTCLWTAERRRWGIFIVVWCIAVADRQSALAWLILPVFDALRWRARAGTSPRKEWLAPALVVLVGIAWFFVVLGTMNVTDIQLERTSHSLQDLRVAPFAVATVSTAVFGLVGLGLGAFAQVVLAPGTVRWPAWPRNTFATIGLAAIGLVLLDVRHLVMSDPECQFLYGTAGRVYATLIICAAALGSLSCRFRVRWDFMACAATSVVLIGMRQMIFDRYAIEIAMIALLAVVPPAPLTAAAAGGPTRFLVPVGVALVTMLGALHVWFLGATKHSIDQAAAADVLYEHALRNDQIRPSELGDAPFPFRGWYLHDYAVTHRLASHRTIAGYSRFTEPSVELWRQKTRFWARLDHGTSASPPNGSRVIAAQEFTDAWFWTTHLFLIRREEPAEPGPLRADFRPDPLPLTDFEWRQLVRGEPVTERMPRGPMSLPAASGDPHSAGR